MFKKKRFIIGGIILLVAVGVLGFLAFRQAAVYYYTVSDVLNKQQTLENSQIRVAGTVLTGSLVQDTNTNIMKFTLFDPSDTVKSLPIVYKGFAPDAFKEGNDAVIEGKLEPSGTFQAQQIIVKCPSKYVPKK